MSAKPSTQAAHETHAEEPTPATPRRTGRFWLLGAVGAAAIGFGVMRFEHVTPAQASSGPAMAVDGSTVHIPAAAPQRRYITLSRASSAAPLAPVPAPARVLVEESRAAPLHPPLAGRIEKVSFQLGQDVKVGQKLVAIRSSEVPELGRELDLARAACDVKKANLARVRDLVDLRALPEKEKLFAEQELREAEIALRAAEGKRRRYQVGSLDAGGLYWVSAPRAGTVVERNALVGMEVGPERDAPLLSIADLDEVIAVADLPERDVGGIAVGDKAEVSVPALGTESLSGTVDYVAQVVDPVRRTVAVRVRVPNPKHRLRPNAFAEVTFLGTGAPRVVVTDEAVVTDDKQSFVFVSVPDKNGHVSEDARLERRAVRMGRTRDGKTEILDGLKDGETYVSKGALLLLNAIDLGS